MIYLTAAQILFIHARLITETGGEHGIHELGLLQSAVGRPQATFEGADLYPETHRKAAALFDSLIRNHPFVDGNKRTAITAAAIFLRQNGWRLKTTPEVLENFTLAAAQGQYSLDQLTRWFEEHSGT